MTRRQTDPLRALTDDERDWLLRVARSQAEPAAHVARAKALCSPSLTGRATPMRPKSCRAALWGSGLSSGFTLQPGGDRRR